jgi:adenine-specific DNA-methyltransferase
MPHDIAPAETASPDFNAQRLAELRRLFPDLFDGEGQLDEAALRALVHPDGAQGVQAFRFDWAGKLDSKRFAFMPSRATLMADRARSVNFDTTGNMIVEGDNLEVLKLLQKTYFEQVKCIYIDPPYNTGNDFIYPDNFAEGKKAYWERNGVVKDGVRLVANPESGGRYHSRWLNMMQPRLLLARQLLREDGVIFISISDAEAHNLRKLCDEIFGEENFIGCIVWNSTKSVTNTALISVSHTYNFVYAKQKSYFVENRPHFRLAENGDGFSNPDNDPRGPWKADPFQVGGERPNQLYEIKNPKTGEVYRPNPGNSWKNEHKVFEKLMADNRIVFGTKGEAGPQRKRFLHEAEERGKVAKTLWEDIDTTKNATKALKTLMGGNLFDNPKPSDLIKRFIQLGAHDSKEAIILDFFAGSGTTAQAVMELNAGDGGTRRYILVQVPEYTDEKSEAYKAGYTTISDLCMERVRRAGAKIQGGADTGFRAYRLAASCLYRPLFAPDPEASEEDNRAALAAYLEAAAQPDLLAGGADFADAVDEIALKNGYGLFYTLEALGEAFPENAVYRLTGNGKSALLCLDETLAEGTADALAEGHADGQLLVHRRALSTATTFTLQTALKDNIRIL